MGQNETPEQPDLTDRQLAALPYIVASASVSDAARLANVGRATLYRWMDDPDFRDELERRRAQAADLARAELRGLMLKGTLVLAEAMEDPDPAIRLRAAGATLHIGLKANDLRELRERLERLDDAFALWSSRRAMP